MSDNQKYAVEGDCPECGVEETLAVHLRQDGSKLLCTNTSCGFNRGMKIVG